MSNSQFNFKQFSICQDRSAFKVGTDGVLLGACAEISSADSILDIGTGTGLVALMAAQRSEAGIIAIEPDEESFAQAVENVRNSKWAGRIKVENSDIQHYHPGDPKFDLILSNPPYFSDSIRNTDPRKSAARHNDHLTSAELLEAASRLMAVEGKFQIIMPYVEGTVFIAEAQRYNLYCSSIIKIKPLPSSQIRRLILSFTRQRVKVMEKFLTIERGSRHEFTEEYINLTKEFYLKF